MATDPLALEQMSREELVARARVLGVERAELMTRVELRDEIVRRSETDAAARARARGWLGVARDLVASVVEAGFNLPDAAKAIRGEQRFDRDWRGPPPVATVTLAEIYAAQGHLERALATLDEVLAAEPDHTAAKALRARLGEEGDSGAPRPMQRPSEEPPVESSERASRSFGREPLEAASYESEAPPASPPDAGRGPSDLPLASDSFFPSDSERPISAAPESFVTLESGFDAPAEPISEAPFDPDSAAEPEPFPAGAREHSVESAPPFSESTLSSAPFAPASEAQSGARAAPEPIAPAPALETDAFATEPAASLDAEEHEADRGLAARAPAEPPEGLVVIGLPHRRFVYWERGARALDQLRARAPAGRPIVRLIAFRPNGSAPERITQDISADPPVGWAFAELGAEAVVRAALGWEQGAEFWPIAVGSELELGDANAAPRLGYRSPTAAVSSAGAAEQRALAELRLASGGVLE